MAQSPEAVLAASRVASLDISKREGKAELLGVLQRAAADLQRKLTQAEGLRQMGRGTPFTEEQIRVTLRQVQDVTNAVKAGMRRAVLDTGKMAADRASNDLVNYMSAADAQFRGIGTPLALNESSMYSRAISGVQSSLLHRLEDDPVRGPGILRRYGDATVGKFEDVLRQGMLQRADWIDTRNALIAESPFLQGEPAHWAERIVRTETMGAYNRAGWEGLRDADEQLGDMVKVLAATFDERTGWDSYQVHGQIRKPDEAFEWSSSKGGMIAFQHPPNRPNDREVVVPHRLSWALPTYLEQKDDGEVHEAWTRDGRKGSPPARPKMTTVDKKLFGKPPPALARATRTQVQVPAQIGEQPVAPPAPARARAAEGLPELPLDARPWEERPRWMQQMGKEGLAAAAESDALLRLSAVQALEYGYTKVDQLGFKTMRTAALDKISPTLCAFTQRDDYWQFKVADVANVASARLPTQRVALSDLTFHQRSERDTSALVNRFKSEMQTVYDVHGNPKKEKRRPPQPTVAIRGPKGELLVLSNPEEAMLARLRGQTHLDVHVGDPDQVLPRMGDASTTTAQSRLALDDSLKGAATDGGRSFRGAARDLLAAEGLQSRDAARLNTEASTLTVRDASKMPDAWGLHTWEGEMVLNSEVVASAKRALTRLAEANTPAKLEALRNTFDGAHDAQRALVYVHEEIHGHSPAYSPAYNGVGAAIEECMTESIARRVMRRLYGEESLASSRAHSAYGYPSWSSLDNAFRGSARAYDDIISRLMTHVGGAIGSNEAAVVAARIEDAAVKTFGPKTKDIRGALDHVQAFTANLGLPADKAKALTETLVNDATFRRAEDRKRKKKK